MAKAPLKRSKIWQFRQCAEEKVRQVVEKSGLPALIARLLLVRGIEEDGDIQLFLQPALASLHDPFLMKDMDKAVDRLVQAREKGETIAIFGDYDADGLTATALLTRTFRWLGMPVISYVPDRLNEGYGMSRHGLDLLHRRGAQLVVTVDNGISCNEEVAYAKTLGMDVIITDHHQLGDKLPEALAVVDPHQPDCPYPFKNLSGVGVAFKLAHGLAKKLDQDPEEAKTFLKSMMDLVALGTVADVVSLLGENRVLVYHGLQKLRQTANPGLAAMTEMLVSRKDKPFTSDNIAFMFAPRLNAAGRTGNAADGLEMLLTDDRDRAWEMAKHLDRLNQDRRNFESEVLEAALAMIEGEPEILEAPALVLVGEEWHPGVVGIVAARLVERYARPAIVLGIEDPEKGIARGSARSVEGFDLHQALAACAEHLEEFGGHKMAAGLTLHVSQFDPFRKALLRYIAEQVDLEDWRPKLQIDGIAHIGELNFDVLDQVNTMRPFGQDNATPLIALLDCEILDQPMRMGNKHLKIKVAQGEKGQAKRSSMMAIWFRYPADDPNIEKWVQPGNRVDLAGKIHENNWNGRRSVELNITDIRPAQPVDGYTAI